MIRLHCANLAEGRNPHFFPAFKQVAHEKVGDDILASLVEASEGERETDRERDRWRERQRERQIEKKTQRERETERER